MAETTGWVLSYSPEYRQLDSSPDTLSRIAAASGGRMAPERPGEIFDRTRIAPSASQPVWPWLLVLAALLLPVDIAVRRLVLTPADIRRGWQRVADRMFRRPALPARAERPERIDALLQAKERARKDQPASGPTEPGGLVEAGGRTPSGKLPEPPRAHDPVRPRGDQAPPSPAVPPAADREKKAPPASTASRLLEQKRMRQRKGEEQGDIENKDD